MRKGKILSLAGFLGAIGTATALIGTAASGTGAYFSDSQAGVVTGTLGTIQVTGSGGTGSNLLDFNWTNMLPGEFSSAQVGYTNSGTSAEDVWIVFPDKYALHALNTLGTYGELKVGGYDYTNLNDLCTGCTPVPNAIKVASNLAPSAAGSISVSFAYAGKLGNEHQGEPFNCYREGNAADLTSKDTPPCDAPDASNGLPYEVVATQVGQSPNVS